MVDNDEIDPYLKRKPSERNTLEDYIGTLLRNGKRSGDPEFQVLMSAYYQVYGAQGRQRIIDIAKDILAKERLNECK